MNKIEVYLDTSLCEKYELRKNKETEEMKTEETAKLFSWPSPVTMKEYLVATK